MLKINKLIGIIFKDLFSFQSTRNILQVVINNLKNKEVGKVLGDSVNKKLFDMLKSLLKLEIDNIESLILSNDDDTQCLKKDSCQNLLGFFF